MQHEIFNFWMLISESLENYYFECYQKEPKGN